MQLDELIDIETQVLADRDADVETLRSRDARLRATLSDEATTRSQRLRAWIHGIRDSRATPLPGQSIRRAYGAAKTIVILVAALVGWGIAESILEFHGDDPIKVLTYLWVFVFLQIFAVVLLLAASVLLRLSSISYDRLPTLAALQAGIRALTRFAWNRWAREKDEERKARALRIWDQLLERRSLYHPAEQWLLLETFQWGAIAFNVAAILRLVTLVASSDLVFGWSTTLDISADTFHAYLQTLSFPWSSLAPSAVPSETLIAATQYSHFDSAYLGSETIAAADARLAGKWWPFLLAATITWGLIPRVILLGYARVRLWRFLTTLRFQTPEFAAVDRRLTRTDVNMNSLTVDPGNVAPLPEANDVVLERIGRVRCLSTIWREADIDEQVIREWLDTKFGYETARIHRTGSADYSADEAFFAAIREEKPQSIAIVVEAWESPEKATLHFIKRVRNEAGAEVGIVVLLIDGAEFDNKLWIDYLGQLHDPYLQVTTP